MGNVPEKVNFVDKKVNNKDDVKVVTLGDNVCLAQSVYDDLFSNQIAVLRSMFEKTEIWELYLEGQQSCLKIDRDDIIPFCNLNFADGRWYNFFWAFGMSINMMPPVEASDCSGEIAKRWTSYRHIAIKSRLEGLAIAENSLPSPSLKGAPSGLRPPVNPFKG
jgi:hypothetical protein